MRHLGVLLAVLAASSGCGEDGRSSGTPAPTAPTVVAPAGPLPEALQRAVALLGQGAAAEAQAVVEAYLVDHPDDARGVFIHGLTYHEARAYAQAEPLFVRALELDPSDALVNHFLGYARFYLGDLGGARQAFETHLAAMPDESDSHFGLGLVALEEGSLDEADDRFRQTIALIETLRATNPPHYARRQSDIAKAHARLGDIAFMREDYEAARDLLHRSIAINPNQYATYYTLSQVERRRGDEAEADRLEQLFREMAAARAGAVRSEDP